jgi:iron complex outermembrane receptor protein
MIANHFALGRAPAPLRLALMAAVSLSAFAAASAASAADAPTTAATADAGATVQELTVTARHREERLQSVPMGISVVQASQAVSQNLNDIADISSSVPSVDFRTSASNKDRTIFIRGAGTISTSPGVEPSVSTVVDGVVMARAGQATVDLLDLDHIEVLRGPQGTLFGKNASAGVVNIITKNPTSTVQGYVDAGVYESAEYRVGAGVSGPIMGDELEGLISAFYGTYGGNVKDTFNGEELNGYSHEGVRGKLLAHIGSDLTLTFAADYTHSTDTTPTGVWVSPNREAYPTDVVTLNPTLAALLTAQGTVPGPNNTQVSQNLPSSVHDDNGGASLQIDWDLGKGYRLTSITAYRDWKNLQLQDYDQMSQAIAGFPQVADTGHLAFHQGSEELRIASPKDQFIDFVAGLYVLKAVDNEIYERDDLLVSGATTTPQTGIAHYGTVDNNYSLFGEADVNFTPKFRAILGYREIWDDLSFYHFRQSTSPVAVTGIGVNFAAQGATSTAGYAARAGLQYDISSDITTYATFSRGYKGPAFNVFFNMAAVNTPPLQPETSNDYEIGIKSQLFDHRLQADLSLFETDFSNYQANFTQEVAGGLTTNLINAGTVTTRGVEGDFIARPTEPLTLTADFTYDDAHVVNFICPPGAASSCFINGQPLPFAPAWKWHLEGDYKVPINDVWSVGLESDYNWQSKTQYQLTETPDTVQPAYGIWNASIGLLGNHNGWQFRVLVKNLTNQHYSPYIAYGDEGGVVRWVPRDNDRYFGFNVHKDF